MKTEDVVFLRLIARRIKHAANQEEAAQWYLSRPDKVRVAMRAKPPFGCYRGVKNRGHYVLYAYEEPEDEGAAVTLKIDHPDDSFLPGHRVFGVPLESVTACGCLVEGVGGGQ